jgi:hypothetical protein
MRAARRIAALASIVALSVAGSTLAVAHGRRTPKPACDSHRRGAELVTRQVIVYGRHSGSAPSGDPATTHYVCLRPRGASLQLGVSWPDDGVYGSDATLSTFRAAGTYVTALATSGEAALAVCSKYQPAGPCPEASLRISVVDARTMRHARISIPWATASRVVAVSPAGAVAWLEYAAANAYTLKATPLRPRGRSGLAVSPQQVDSGQIDRTSVRFDGRTLTWTRDGLSHSQRIGP